MLIRSIWNDGQSLTTPELQRNCDIAAYADDRALEVLLTPGQVLKKVMPILEETASVNPRLLLIPSASNGKVTCQPAYFLASSSLATAITYAAKLDASDDIPANIASNSSGQNRYDLIYATVNRQVAATIASPPGGAAYTGIGQASTGTSSTQSRKIKSVVDGSISTQSVNLYDVPQVQLAVNQGFLTGATPPTTAQINAALPADTATSFNFALAYITVANGYTSGTAIAQSAITPAWNGGWLQQHRMHGLRPMSFYSGAISEKTAGSLPSERWGSYVSYFGHFKLLTTTADQSTGPGSLLDNSIDWRHRFVVVTLAFLGNATTLGAVESITTPIHLDAPGSATPALQTKGFFTGTGPGALPTDLYFFDYISGGNGLALNFHTDGTLRVCKRGTGPTNGASGDLIMVSIFGTDQFVTGM